MMKFYPAYAIRHFVTVDDVIPTPYQTYEEAYEAAEQMLFDDDDCGVFAFNEKDGRWTRVRRRSIDGKLIFELL